MSDLKQKVLSGLVWRSMERFGTQAMGFVVSIALARLLVPKDYGLLALLTVFIALANVLVDSGFGSALIQKKTADARDFNSIFYLSLGVSAVLYGVLWVLAPWIAQFYSEPLLILVVRWTALSLFFNALNGIQDAVLAREMRFKLSFYIGSSQTIAMGVVGVGMAYVGYGVWSLVFGSLASLFVGTLVRWGLVGWRPKWLFSWVAVKGLFRFGSRMLVSGFLECLFSNLYNLIIGKLFSPVTLGYYNRGQSIPNMVMTSVNGTISSVIFPALSQCQHDTVQVKSIVRRMVTMSSFLVFPAMFGLAAVAKPLVVLLLTEKWLPCVPYLQLSCITFAFFPMHVANLQAIMALGRSDIFLKLEVIKKVLVILMILGTFKFGVMAMVVGQAVCGLFCAIINAWPNRQLIGYSILDQSRDVLPALLLSTAMGVVVFMLTRFPFSPPVLILLQVLLGAGLYFTGARLLNLESANYLFENSRPWVVSMGQRVFDR